MKRGQSANWGLQSGFWSKNCHFCGLFWGPQRPDLLATTQKCGLIIFFVEAKSLRCLRQHISGAFFPPQLLPRNYHRDPNKNPPPRLVWMSSAVLLGCFPLVNSDVSRLFSPREKKRGILIHTCSPGESGETIPPSVFLACSTDTSSFSCSPASPLSICFSANCQCRPYLLLFSSRH